MLKTTSMTVLLACTLLSILLQPLLAREQFGTASVKKGVLTVMRSGELQPFTEGKETTVQQLDLLTAGENALISWQLDESTVLEIGGHGMVMLRPWLRAGDNGYINLVYGALRLQSGGTVTIKTPSAVLHVTGTVLVEVTATGSTLADVVTGKLDINSLGGRSASLDEGRAALVVNRELVVPPADQLAGLNLGGQSLNRPLGGAPGSESFKTEAALLGAGILSEDELRESKVAIVSIEESFDLQVDSETALEKRTEKPVSSEMARDLESFSDMPTIEVKPETEELGTIRIREDTPADVFAEFSEPRSPRQLFDLDDKTGWSRESGLIQLTVEK